MNLNQQFYLSQYNNDNCPTWVKNERYSYCEQLYRIFSLFRKK